MLETYLIYLL